MPLYGMIPLPGLIEGHDLDVHTASKLSDIPVPDSVSERCIYNLPVACMDILLDESCVHCVPRSAVDIRVDVQSHASQLASTNENLST